MTILVTGATGNVGSEVLRALHDRQTDERVLVASRDATGGPDHRYFDFDDAGTFPAALEDVDYVFLLRPPTQTAVRKVYGPLIDELVSAGVRGVVFLSVYGADTQRLLPHHTIERMLSGSGLPHYFLRPTYFMQNLTTTLYDQVKTGHLDLPAGDAVFNWVDVRDIGAAAANLLLDFPNHPDEREGITLATYENLDFHRVAERSQGTALPFTYTPVSVPVFILDRRAAGDAVGYAAAVAAIHYLQRFQQPVMARTDWRQLIGRDPHTLQDFFDRVEG